jgi:Protein of unknown function (DUF3467)
VPKSGNGTALFSSTARFPKHGHARAIPYRTGAGRILDPKEREVPMEGKLEGRYANHFEIGFTALEFLFDFGQFDEDSGSAIRHTRIITNPASAKTFWEMLREVLTEYETSIGKTDGTERRWT